MNMDHTNFQHHLLVNFKASTSLMELNSLTKKI